MMENILETTLYGSYLLVLLCLLGMLVIPVRKLVVSRQLRLRALLGLIALNLTFALAWYMADGATFPKYVEEGVNSGGSQMIGAGLNMTYLLVVMVGIGVVVFEVRKRWPLRNISEDEKLYKS